MATKSSSSSSSASATTPPNNTDNFGLDLLKYDDFHQTIPVTGLRVPKLRVATIVQSIKSSVLKEPKIRPVNSDPTSSDHRIILLGKHVKKNLSGLDVDHKKIILEMLNSGEVSEVESSYDIGYNHMSASDIFRRLIPNVKEWPSSFETAGHVAHINLRAELLPYKLLIGRVLLEKNKHIKTVVNKTSTIASEFRTFPMELIAGVDDTMVQVKEFGARFKFDFREVYWNSRLQHEHELIVKSIRKEQVVCDMMAGIGPFAIPCAQKGCTVYANDLNPKSYEYLCENTILNKVNENLRCYNLCGRVFVKELVEKQIQFDQVLMNLPATAIDFLDVFVGLLNDDNDSWWTKKSPLIHTYCFSSEADRSTDVMNRVGNVLGCDPKDLVDVSVREVRDVAPNKWMMCITFRVPEIVLYGRSKKRRKLEE